MRILPVNLNTILVELDDLAQTLALLASLQAEPIAAIDEIVPAARTLMIRLNPAAMDRTAILREISSRRIDGTVEQSGRRIEIPVTYNGEDLEEVARVVGISAKEVIRRHTGTDYVVAFTGFAPGFAYLSGGDPSLNVPRRKTPRPRLEAGSVALAGGFSAVYPQASPGGWQIVGHTDTPMWDLDREQPALLQPGDRVRFVKAAAKTPGVEETAPLKAEATQIGPLQIRSSGLISLFQDLGRPGQAKQGVSVSGAMDKASLAAANRMVGNPETETCIEIAYGGFELLCLSETVIAITGARCAFTITDAHGARTDKGSAAITLKAGDTLKIGNPVAGVFSYLAVRGGFDVPHVLGSASTDFMAKIGRTLSAGEFLQVKTPNTDLPPRLTALPAGLPKAKEITVIDVVMGPRTDWFSQNSRDVFTLQPWTVTSQSNRVGLRLSGANALTRSEEMEGKELPSEGTVRGAIQIPAAGQPILFMSDHPLTGGYPVIACVAEYHLDLAGQLPIGALVRFRPISFFETIEI